MVGSRSGTRGSSWDIHIELQWLRARWLDPSTGRFLSPDTWTGVETRPMSYNLWQYAYANAIFYTDPSGQDPWWCDHQSDPAKCYRGFSTSYDRFDRTLPYIYREMLANAQSKQVQQIGSWLGLACTTDTRLLPASGSTASMALSLWTLMVRKGAPWDHKPKLDTMLRLRRATTITSPFAVIRTTSSTMTSGRTSITVMWERRQDSMIARCSQVPRPVFHS